MRDSLLTRFPAFSLSLSKRAGRMVTAYGLVRLK